jgi:hypothetical protein
MRAISVHVDEQDYQELKTLASSTGQPVAALIREAMAVYLEAKHGTEGQSLLDLPPLQAGRQLRSWSRSEIYDEMFGAGEPED